MGRELYSRFELGDMIVHYIKEERGQLCMELVPAGREKDIKEMKRSNGDCLIQAKLVGDTYPSAYAPGVSMRNSGTVKKCVFDSQKTGKDGNVTWIETVLKDERGYRYLHRLRWTEGDLAVDCDTTFCNDSDQTAVLEMLSSFSVSEITPFTVGDAPETLKIHRIRSKWAQEGRRITESAEDLLLEPAWGGNQVNSIRYGQLGSMPVRGYFPFAAVEDEKNKVVWAAMLAIESSWQMEIYRRDDGVSISGGIADREFGHWMKEIAPGESFTSPKAILTVVSDDVDTASQRLTQYGEKYVNQGPESEQTLPVMFNEYCTTWGLPSHDNIASIVEAVKGKGLEYFVIDCGWFVKDGKNWWDSMGDYVPSSELFPKGLLKTSDTIRAAGMKPGIWYEIDNVANNADVYSRDDWMLHRDGLVLETDARRFFDMRKPEVIDYLSDRVIGQLKKYHFDYMKMDYNDTIGIGCDGAESLGEGLRLDREASVEFVRKVKREIPGIILENCASGGHKLEPLMMSICSMASFSDAHECEEIPVIAAALHRTILPRQSQIWAVIRKTDTIKRIAYTLAATFLGRMCFSGDVTELSKEQWKTIEDGIAFYKEIAPIIKNGFTRFYSEKGASDRHLKGWQCILREKSEKGKLKDGEHEEAFAVFHQFHGELPEEVSIRLPEGCPERILSVYSGTEISAQIKNHCLIIRPTEEMEAVAVHLVR